MYIYMTYIVNIFTQEITRIIPSYRTHKFELNELGHAPCGKNCLGDSLSLGAQTCELHQCGVLWSPSEYRSTWVGDSDQVCCEPRCALMSCGEGWAVNDLKVDQVGVTREECCSKTCSLVKCAVGWKVPENRLKSVPQKETECCQKTCEHHVCGHGYVKDATKNGFLLLICFNMCHIFPSISVMTG